MPAGSGTRYHVSEPFGVLGLKPGCSAAEARAAYVKLAKQHHPDVSSAANAGEEFRRITDAYDSVATHIKARSSGHAGAGGHAGYDAERMAARVREFRQRASGEHADCKGWSARDLLGVSTARRMVTCVGRFVLFAERRNARRSRPRGQGKGGGPVLAAHAAPSWRKPLPARSAAPACCEVGALIETAEAFLGVILRMGWHSHLYACETSPGACVNFSRRLAGSLCPAPSGRWAGGGARLRRFRCHPGPRAQRV